VRTTPAVCWPASGASRIHYPGLHLGILTLQGCGGTSGRWRRAGVRGKKSGALGEDTPAAQGAGRAARGGGPVWRAQGRAGRCATYEGGARVSAPRSRDAFSNLQPPQPTRLCFFFPLPPARLGAGSGPGNSGRERGTSPP
jgi:hypothetical protein